MTSQCVILFMFLSVFILTKFMFYITEISLFCVEWLPKWWLKTSLWPPKAYSLRTRRKRKNEGPLRQTQTVHSSFSSLSFLSNAAEVMRCALRQPTSWNPVPRVGTGRARSLPNLHHGSLIMSGLTMRTSGERVIHSLQQKPFTNHLSFLFKI